MVTDVKEESQLSTVNQYENSNRHFALTPKNLDEALRFAEILAKSTIVPKDFQNNPGNVFVAIQWGMELGIQPMQAMQSIAVINGRPALWGDTVIALVRNSPLCEYVYETDDGETATCRVKRRGEEEQIRTFSMADAQLAGLKGKQGPWTQHPKRMRQMRARAFALRDVFADVLRGMAVAEELQDYPENEIGKIPKSTAPARPAIEQYPQQSFDTNFPKWEDAIKGGRKTCADVIAALESKAMLTEEMKTKINNVKAAESAEVIEQ